MGCAAHPWEDINRLYDQSVRDLRQESNLHEKAKAFGSSLSDGDSVFSSH